MRVDEHTIEVAGTPVFYRTAPVATGPTTLYLHGLPTSSDDWIKLLGRTGGIAPDLIGFGRSGKAGNLDYTLGGLAGFLERLLAELGVEQLRIVAHDWGAGAGLVLAERDPQRIDRLVLCNPLPLASDAGWSRLARLLRRPGIGELIMGSTPRWLFARTVRRGCAHPEVFTDARVRSLWAQFDQGTQRALLRLHRSLDERLLGAMAARLDALRMPVLILWGEQDPWFSVEFAEGYARRVPGATVERVSDAGHWPWLERDDVADRIAEFVTG